MPLVYRQFRLFFYDYELRSELAMLSYSSYSMTEQVWQREATITAQSDGNDNYGAQCVTKFSVKVGPSLP
jgi:hypothetical protein